jgi:hypothetical protein
MFPYEPDGTDDVQAYTKWVFPLKGLPVSQRDVSLD